MLLAGYQSTIRLHFAGKVVVTLTSSEADLAV
jgi:hypothetical protein